MKKNDIFKYISQLKKLEYIKSSPDILDTINTIENRINDHTFKIAVVGEFSSGKSTFINAIIGKDILLHSTEETTATITYIHNVTKNDARLNTCIINYNSGKSLKINKLTDLAKYTTAQSNDNVAEKIANVEVFIHFLNVNHPFIIVDTPGLNGIADKHREITINEIQKAHACIYLVPLKGIAKSDIEFIKLLSKYQSHFIFIQNFRDSLKPQEGETPELKISQLKDILEDEIFSCGIMFEYFHIICLSALMALVSNDKSIARLYENSDPLTDEDRKKLRFNSNFAEFENTLQNYISEGKYKHAIIFSAIKSLEELLNHIIIELNNDNDELQQLLKNELESEKNIKIQELINKFKQSIDINKKKIKNFVNARKSDSCSICRNYIKNEFMEINSKINHSIDAEIKEYEDIEKFPYCHNRKTIGRYFSDELNTYIKNTKAHMDMYLSEHLQSIYILTIMQIKKYNSLSEKNKSENFQTNFSDFSAEMYNRSVFATEKEKLQNKKAELNAKQNEARNLDNNQKNKAEEALLERYMREENQRHSAAENSIISKQRSIGRKPEYRSWTSTETRTKTVYRGGLGIMDKLLGPKTVQYNHTLSHDNSDEIRRWEAKNRDIINAKMHEEEQHKAKCNEIILKKKHLEQLQQRNQAQASRIQQQIKQLNDEIISEQKNIETLEKRAKTELMNTTKKNLKTLIQNESDLMSDKFHEYISKTLDSNAEQITKLALKKYENSVQEKISELESIVNGNTEELKNKYKLKNNELKEFKNILLQLKKYEEI